MEKRPKKLAAGPSHHATGGMKKMVSHEKESVLSRPSQLLRDKRRASSHDSQALDLGEEESVTDFTKAELMVFKTSFARPKYANTYRMEPYKKFMAHLVRKKAEDILKISSRWVWDIARDNWVSIEHETENFIAVALIVAGYYE
ncbi:hypothetical protein lerEdw1_006188 [Lerista edwardsae]|nr:hypothetical protein lerEdw1_006188 [Lerista edwardsae]